MLVQVGAASAVVARPRTKRNRIVSWSPRGIMNEPTFVLEADRGATTSARDAADGDLVVLADVEQHELLALIEPRLHVGGADRFRHGLTHVAPPAVVASAGPCAGPGPEV